MPACVELEPTQWSLMAESHDAAISSSPAEFGWQPSYVSCDRLVVPLFQASSCFTRKTLRMEHASCSISGRSSASLCGLQVGIGSAKRIVGIPCKACSSKMTERMLAADSVADPPNAMSFVPRWSSAQVGLHT